MIAGPILPRTAEGLWSVVQDDPGRVEHGLEFLRRDLQLEDGLRIDALAADAAGRPVLVFASMVEHDHALPARLADTVAWFARSGPIVRALLDGARVRLEIAPRVLVVGFEFTERCLARLRADVDHDLVVVRVDAMRVAGRTHVGTTVVHASQRHHDAGLAAIASGEVAPRVARLADLLARLDEDLAIDGDRFARTWRCDGVPIVRLERAARSVIAAVPGHRPIALAHDEAVDEVVDLASRRYLGIVAAWNEVPGAVAPVVAAPPRPPALGREVRDTHERREAQVDVASAEVSAAEYDAFFADGPSEGPA